MSVIGIHLLEGFEGDSAEVRVDGAIVFESSSVNYRVLLGFAESIETEVGQGPEVEVDIRIPSRALSLRVVVDLAEKSHLMCSIRDGALEWSLSRAPVGFA